MANESSLRPIIKDLFLILLNADNEVKAVRAGNNLLKEHREYYILIREHGLNVKNDLIPMLKAAHKAAVARRRVVADEQTASREVLGEPLLDL